MYWSTYIWRCVRHHDNGEVGVTKASLIASTGARHQQDGKRRRKQVAVDLVDICGSAPYQKLDALLLAAYLPLLCCAAFPSLVLKTTLQSPVSPNHITTSYCCCLLAVSRLRAGTAG